MVFTHFVLSYHSHQVEIHLIGGLFKSIRDIKEIGKRENKRFTTMLNPLHYDAIIIDFEIIITQGKHYVLNFYGTVWPLERAVVTK